MTAIDMDELKRQFRISWRETSWVTRISIDVRAMKSNILRWRYI